MELHPTRPPGRANRKALVYAAEIQRLHASGHSLEAIRLALQAVGIEVSRSTVHREVTRPRSGIRPLPPRSSPSPVQPAASPPAEPERFTPASLAADPRSGKEIAEAFMKGRIFNPLLTERKQP